MKKFQNKNILSKRFDYELGDIISALKNVTLKMEIMFMFLAI